MSPIDCRKREIACAWGYSKLPVHYRRNKNVGVSAHLDANVKKALTRELLTTNRFRNYARKARDYKLTYEYILAPLTQAQDASAGKLLLH
jgi:hypothetical protein